MKIAESQIVCRNDVSPASGDPTGQKVVVICLMTLSQPYKELYIARPISELEISKKRSDIISNNQRAAVHGTGTVVAVSGKRAVLEENWTETVSYQWVTVEMDAE